MRGETIAMILGGLLGMAVVVYPFVYLPMSANYTECGSVFLCSNQ